MRRARPILAQAIIGTILGSLCVLSACSQAPKAPGQLVVAIDTDMALPDQVDTIELTVTANGMTALDVPMSVGSGLDAQPIPATLTIVAGSDPAEPVTVRVIGWKGATPRTLRQVVTTIPTDRVALLRMPLQWLCDGTAQPIADAGLPMTGNYDGAAYESACGDGSTCEAGQCVPSLNMTPLPAYEPQAVFGGGSAPSGTGQTAGTCFDTVACLVSGSIETPDDQCTVAVPAGGAGVNVGLRVADDGICDTTGTTCFVPLDGDSAEGWISQNGRIVLPTAVCTKLRNGLVAGVVVSTTCPTKTDADPPCGAWSSVAPADDADASVSPTVPSLVASAVPDGGAASACCPLMADSSRLYTCLCNGTAPVQIIAIDPASGSITSIGTFSPQSLRARYAAVLAGGEVYWIDRTTGDAGTTCPVFATSIADGGTGSPVAVIDGDVYDGADLLADSANLYALADSVSGLAATASPVQLLSIARGTGVVTPLDTGGAQTILQFAQDMNDVYVGVDTDVALEGGVDRTSRVVQFPKGGGSSVTIAQSTLTTPNAAYGGYIGLADDGTTLFALFQQMPAADGTVDTQVLKLGAAGTTPSVVYDEVLPTISTLRLLGAVNGAVVMARDVAPQPDAGDATYGSTASESSVLAIPAGGGAPRIIASFVNDSPIFELQAPAFSADTFWVNGSGRVFSLPAGALQ